MALTSKTPGYQGFHLPTGSRPAATYMLHPRVAYTPCIAASSSSCSRLTNWSSCSCHVSHPRASSRSHELHIPRASGSDMPGSSSNGGRPNHNSGSGGGSGMSRRSKPDRKARKPGLFEIKVMTPPPQSLGIYALPPNTHNGEEIEIDGQGYVVTSLVLKYKLVKGRYVRDHSRLEVQPTSRYFLNMMLDNLISARYIGPVDTGYQD